MEKVQLATNNANIKTVCITVVKTVAKTYKTKHIISTKNVNTNTKPNMLI